MIVKTVTCDGTATNNATMKKFGCKIGSNMALLDGRFTFKGRQFLFMPDMPHMLKLGRNALSELKVFLDENGEKIEWRFFENLHDEQQKEGIKFANKLSSAHINYHRHKMNVKLAAQTFSSSVADALQFFREAGHLYFEGAGATIKFVRVVDRIFDLLNSRNPLGKGFKAPMRASSKPVWEAVISNTVTYLAGLKDKDGVPLLKHRRNTFVKGIIISAQSASHLGNDVLFRPHNPFKFICFYRVCQDHAELLFSGVRTQRNGDNNNPNVPQFKSSLKPILLHAAVTASKFANCTTFDTDADLCSPIFSLKWSKSSSALTTPPEKVDDIDWTILEQPFFISEYKENAIAYIGGYIVRKLSQSMDCATCCRAMTSTDLRKSHFSLIRIKDNGGLAYPSDDIIKILTVCEKYFNLYVRRDGEGMSACKNLHAKLQHSIISELSVTRPAFFLFSSLLQHDIDTHQ